MIVFTEHNEVVMLVSDMRSMLRSAAITAHRLAQEEPLVPVSFIAQSLADSIEKEVRNDPHAMGPNLKEEVR